MHNYAAQKLVSMYEQGFPVEPLCNFITNIMANPSNRAVEDLMKFLEYGNLPITQDGHFLAYKKVRDDYLDCHSASIDNSVGQVVSMPRNEVNDNPNQTCSHGLHFASLEYARSFSGSRMMVVKIDPRDVVAIPVDYNNTKGRCARYEVVSELAQSAPDSNVLGDKAVHDFSGPEPDDEEFDTCIECGELIDDFDDQCPHCGYWQ